MLGIWLYMCYFAHMIVDNTLNQYIPSIHVDCHLVGCKPREDIRW